MEFGKLASIEDVDWAMPPEDPLTAEYLRSLNPNDARTSSERKARVFVGAPAWGRREWLGEIYPPGTRTADFLKYYARNFQTIELNTTHYRIPTAEMIAKWIALVPPTFRFCPKIWQGLSHGGLEDRDGLAAWLETLPEYREHLGACFLQLPPGFDYAQKAQLFHFLREWPDQYPLAVEFRHPSWFTGEGTLLPALVRYFQGRGIGSVITDVAGRRDVLHSSVSAPFTMIRFIGNDLHASDFARAKDWARRLSRWQEEGLREAYFFVHQPDDIRAPKMADAVIQDLNEIAGADLPPLHWVGQTKLFDV